MDAAVIVGFLAGLAVMAGAQLLKEAYEERRDLARAAALRAGGTWGSPLEGGGGTDTVGVCDVRVLDARLGDRPQRSYRIAASLDCSVGDHEWIRQRDAYVAALAKDGRRVNELLIERD
jgi:hypothetical protein